MKKIDETKRRLAKRATVFQAEVSDRQTPTLNLDRTSIYLYKEDEPIPTDYDGEPMFGYVLKDCLMFQ